MYCEAAIVTWDKQNDCGCILGAYWVWGENLNVEGGKDQCRLKLNADSNSQFFRSLTIMPTGQPCLELSIVGIEVSPR